MVELKNYDHLVFCLLKRDINKLQTDNNFAANNLEKLVLTSPGATGPFPKLANFTTLARYKSS